METVTLTFKYTQSEYVRAEKRYLLASKTITKTSVIFVGLYFLFSIFYLFLSSYSVMSIIALMFALIAGSIGSILYFYIPVLKFRQTSKYHDEYTLIFSRDGIKFKTPKIDSVLQWDNYSELWESDDHYFLIQAPRLYSLIPKRAFKNPADKQVFEEFAMSNMKCAKRTI